MGDGVKRYEFRPVGSCNMCGAPQADHRILGRRADRSQGMRPWRSRGITTSVAQCGRCGLIFADPQPIPFDLQDHYGVPPETYWREEYFKVSDGYFQRPIDRFKAIARSGPGMQALDIGAGLGKAMIALERAGFEAHGFEPSVPFYERAIARMGIGKDRLQLGDMEHIEYDHGRFHFITFGAVLEHLYDPSASIGKALQWLAPGGVIHIEVPSSRWLINRIVNAAYRVQGLDYVGNISPMHSPFHLYEFGLESFHRNGKVLGYTVALHEYDVCATYMPRALDPLLRWVMGRTGTGMQLSVWLQRDVLAHGPPDRDTPPGS